LAPRSILLVHKDALLLKKSLLNRIQDLAVGTQDLVLQSPLAQNE
jgi:hypothetical protein